MNEKVEVLIMDDDKVIREMYAEALEGIGFKVLQAENGKEGVEMALAHHPAAILVDIMMPILGGHAAVHLIRKDPWGKDAKIIYLTNMEDAGNIVMAVEHGTEKYVIKANTPIKEVVNLVRTVAHA
jgi:CheY-like chemotaxis protein